jgi:Na+/phosphate symporter
LEEIGEIIEDLGKKIKFKLDSVQKESENIITMLAECFQKYNKELNAFSFSLEAEEVKKAAEISRFSCN